MSKKYIVFFIGTIAEYIKLFPVIEEIKKSNIPYKIIASGQNEISDTDIAKETKLTIDLQLSYEKNIVKNVFGLFSWFFKGLITFKKPIKEAFTDVDFKNSIMVVHGDTLSTVMGAYLAKKLGMRIAHIEAGLRSHHIFSPFPEELDRLTVSKMSDLNFCQGSEAVKNLSKSKGKTINTQFNTILDAINYSKNVECKSNIISRTENQRYCIFVIHRQENLLKSNLVTKVVEEAINASKEIKVIFVVHKITENTLKKLNLYNTLVNQENIITVERLNYFEFMKILSNSEFVITDGGSNQEELSYMGKPTLILRTATERNEGIGSNAIMYKNDIGLISRFVKDYSKYKRPEVSYTVSPSKIIKDSLINEME